MHFQNQQRKALVTFLFLLCFSPGPVWSQATDPDPKEILKRSAEAIRQVQTFQYRAESVLTAVVEGPSASGTVLLEPMALTDEERAQRNTMFKDVLGRFKVKMDVLTFSELLGEQQHIYDGETFYIVSKEQQAVIKIPTVAATAVPPSSLARHQLVWFEFYNPDHWVSQYINKPLLYDGIEEVAGVPCHIIRWEYYAWYISVDDYLPRRRDQSNVYAIITDLKVNEPVADDVFSLKPPTGYAYKERK